MNISFLKSAFKEGHYPPPDRPEVAFAGRSNVGKSSLINVLTNRKKLARTSSTPGRTQAINYFTVDERLFLVDLPGYGFARVPLSVKKIVGEMVEIYLRTRSNLKAVVVILDVRREPNEGDMNLLDWLDLYGICAIIVLTKTDKLSRNKAEARVKLIQGRLKNYLRDSPIVFSAKTRVGREKIWEQIENAIT